MDRKLKLSQWIGFIILAFLILVPVLYSLGGALFCNNHLSENLKSFDSNTIKLLLNSILLAISVAFLSSFAGSILGFLLYKTDFAYRQFFKIIFLIPLFISPYIWAVAWKDFFFTLTGPTPEMQSYGDLILVQTLIYTPLAMLITGSAFAHINASLEEAGLMVFPIKKVFFKIILPLIKPALLAAFTLIFIFSISEFSVPAFYGLKVFTTEIFTQFSAFYNYNLAILQSTILVLICLLLILSEQKYLSQAPFLSVSNRGNQIKLYALKTYRFSAYAFLIFWLTISILIPFGSLTIEAFQDGYQTIFKAFELLKSTIAESFILAVTGSLISIFTGVLFAYLSWSKRTDRTSSISKLIHWTLLITFAIPSLIFGISLIKFYNRSGLYFIYGSALIIIIGYMGKYGFIAYKMIENAIRQLPYELDEVAQTEGLPRFKRLQKIIIPLITPAIFGAFILNFMLMFGDLGTSIIIYPPGTQLMPVKVFTLMANAPQSLTAALTFIVFCVTLCIISLFYIIFKKFLKPTYDCR